jgi:hypothetical protein
MKLMFLMDSPEYLRFYDTAIAELAARGHEVDSGRDEQPGNASRWVWTACVRTLPSCASSAWCRLMTGRGAASPRACAR